MRGGVYWLDGAPDRTLVIGNLLAVTQYGERWIPVFIDMQDHNLKPVRMAAFYQDSTVDREAISEAFAEYGIGIYWFAHQRYIGIDAKGLIALVTDDAALESSAYEMNMLNAINGLTEVVTHLHRLIMEIAPPEPDAPTPKPERIAPFIRDVAPVVMKPPRYRPRPRERRTRPTKD